MRGHGQSHLQRLLLRTRLLHRVRACCPHCPSVAAADRSHACTSTKGSTMLDRRLSLQLAEPLQANCSRLKPVGF